MAVHAGLSFNIQISIVGLIMVILSFTLATMGKQITPIMFALFMGLAHGLGHFIAGSIKV